jgi:WD40 repeat protein
VAEDEPAVQSVALSPSGDLMAVGRDGGVVTVWNIADRADPEQTATLSDLGETVRSVAFSPDGRYLAAGDEDGTAALWDPANPYVPLWLTSVKTARMIWSTEFSPDGRTLVTSSESETTLWNAPAYGAPQLLAPPLGRDGGPLTALRFGPGGKSLAMGSTPAMGSIPAVGNTGRRQRSGT